MTLRELATLTGAGLDGDPDVGVSGVATLETAGPGDIAFLSNSRYRGQLGDSAAGAVILKPEDRQAWPGNALVTEDPYLCYARISARLYPTAQPVAGIHESAVVAASARIHPSVHVGPLCVVGENAVLGAGVIVGPGCVVDQGASIGARTRLVSRVTLGPEVELGEDCIVHPGAVIGSDGFGFANDGGRWIKVPQLGRVIIGDQVEVGANTTIDRGSLKDTRIESGVKLDNLIQIAHNVSLGENTAIAACSGIAGSTTVGRGCTLGGATGLAGHLEIGDGVHFTGKSLVTRSFSRPGSYSGNLPAMPSGAWRRLIARLRHLDELFQRVKTLEKFAGAAGFRPARPESDKN